MINWRRRAPPDPREVSDRWTRYRFRERRGPTQRSNGPAGQRLLSPSVGGGGPFNSDVRPHTGVRQRPSSNIRRMQVTTGTVIGGKIVVEGVPLVEGAVVTVLSREPDEPFVLSYEDEDELLAAITEVEGGDFLSAEQVLESIRKYG